MVVEGQARVTEKVDGLVRHVGQWKWDEDYNDDSSQSNHYFMKKLDLHFYAIILKFHLTF